MWPLTHYPIYTTDKLFNNVLQLSVVIERNNLILLFLEIFVRHKLQSYQGIYLACPYQDRKLYMIVVWLLRT